MLYYLSCNIYVTRGVGNIISHYRDVSETTKQSYQKSFEGLAKRFLKSTDLSMLEDTYEFLRWIDDLKFKLSNSTRRQYRNAIKYGLREYNIDFDDAIPKFLVSNVTRSTVRKYHGKRTSALKSKFIRPEVLEQLIDYLDSSNSASALLIKNMLIASIHFGLRPIEWMDASWTFDSGNTKGLLVKNAKHSHGRSHGEHRTIWMDSYFSPELQPILVQAVKSADSLIEYFKKQNKQTEDDFIPDVDSSASTNEASLYFLKRQVSEAIIIKARQYLNQLYRKNTQFKKLSKRNRITLYSARHQFAANAKKAGLEPEDIAALMGHASIDTNQASYGRRASGTPGGFGVVADAHDVERVLEPSPPKEESTLGLNR